MIPPRTDSDTAGPIRRFQRPGAPRHAFRPPPRFGCVLGFAGVVVGVFVGLLAVVVGFPAVVPRPPHNTEGAAAVSTATAPVKPITVSVLPTATGLSDRQILQLLDRPPRFGALDDTRRRVSCLSGLGYPAATSILGAGPVEIDGKSGILLVLAGEEPDTVRGLVVAAQCTSADTGLITEKTVHQP